MLLSQLSGCSRNKETRHPHEKYQLVFKVPKWLKCNTATFLLWVFDFLRCLFSFVGFLHHQPDLPLSHYTSPWVVLSPGTFLCSSSIVSTCLHAARILWIQSELTFQITKLAFKFKKKSGSGVSFKISKGFESVCYIQELRNEDIREDSSRFKRSRAQNPCQNCQTAFQHVYNHTVHFPPPFFDLASITLSLLQPGHAVRDSVTWRRMAAVTCSTVTCRRLTATWPTSSPRWWISTGAARCLSSSWPTPSHGSSLGPSGTS